MYTNDFHNSIKLVSQNLYMDGSKKIELAT